MRLRGTWYSGWGLMCLAICLTAVGGDAGASLAWGDDFHVQNKLFDPDQKEPIVSTTLFYAGRVYDFMSNPAETVVFDPGRDLFELIDPMRRLRTQITTGEISKNISLLREAARQWPRESKLGKFYLNPKFAETQDPDTGEIVLDSTYITYRLKTFVPTNPQAARQYCAFADWSVQLNAVLNPSPNLPFPRLAVNAALKQRQELPLEVTFTLRPVKRRGKERVIRAEHDVQPRLSQDDRQRINEVHEQLHTFDVVKFEEYHQPVGQQAAAEKKGFRR